MKLQLHSLRFKEFFFSLALGYCFIFYTGGLFFYDLRPVNLDYFHKFFQRLFHMVQIRQCIDEMAPKSVTVLFFFQTYF